jgi:hypothetical protein
MAIRTSSPDRRFIYLKSGFTIVGFCGLPFYRLFPVAVLKPRGMYEIAKLRSRSQITSGLDYSSDGSSGDAEEFFNNGPKNTHPCYTSNNQSSKNEHVGEMTIQDGADPLHSSTYSEMEDLVKPLLQECSQTAPLDFECFFSTFPFTASEFLSSSRSRLAFHSKIGEATYSEVFGYGDIVLKVIPVRNAGKKPDLDEDENWPTESEVDDVVREIVTTRALGDLAEGFIKLIKYICFPTINVNFCRLNFVGHML